MYILMGVWLVYIDVGGSSYILMGVRLVYIDGGGGSYILMGVWARIY